MDFKAMLNQLSQLSEATKQTPTGKVHKADPGGYGRIDDEDDKKKEKEKEKEKVAEPAVKRGRGRPKKGADSETGEVAKYANAPALQSFMVGNLPKGKLPGKTTKKHTLKDWMELVQDNMLAEAEQITIEPAKASTQVIRQGTKTLGTVSNPQLATQIKKSIGTGEMSLTGSELGEDGMGKNYNSGEDKEAQDWLKDPKLETQVLKLIAYGIKLNVPEKGIKGIGQGTGLGKEYYDYETTASNPMYFKEFLKYLIKNGYRYKVKGIPTSDLQSSLSEYQGVAEGFNYKQVHSSWSVLPSNKKEFSTPYKLDKEKEARAHAERIGGKLVKIDQRGHIIKTGSKADKSVAEGFNYKQVHSSWSVRSPKKNEFNTPYKLDQEEEARAHAERIGGKLVKIDQRGHSIRTGSKADKGVAEGKQHLAELRASEVIGVEKIFAKFPQLIPIWNKYRHLDKWGGIEDIIRNIRQAFPNMSDKEVKKLADYFYADRDSDDRTGRGAFNAAVIISSHLEHQKQDADQAAARANQIMRKARGNLGSMYEQGVAEGKLDYSPKKARAGQDIGKPGKQFAKIAKGAAERYGSEEKGNKVAGAVLKKLRSPQKESIEEGFMDSVKGMFGKNPTAAPSMGQQPSSTSSNMDIDLSADPNREPYRFMRIPDNASREIIKSKFRTLAKKYHPDMQGGNSDIMAKLNTAMARIAYRMGITRLEEVDLPSDQMDMGAGLGAGRSSTTLEGKKAKPDFLDLDKDKNKKESMAKAAKDAKKKKKVTESSHRHSAAKLLGKSHALAKEGYNCRFEDMDEARMYHEGYKEGLDECYGQGVYEMAPPATVPGMASAAMSMPSMEEDMFDEGFMDSVKGVFGKKPTTAPSTGQQPSRTRLPDSPFELDDYPFPSGKGEPTKLPPGYIPPRSPHQDEPSTAFRGPMMPHPDKVKADSDLMDYSLAREGTAFTGALANTPKGGKFSLGGKTFTDTSDLDEMSLAFESLDKQLKSLLESEEVNEGMTVSISKGQQGMPDSVTVSAQDSEADQLLGLIKQAGLGLFGDNQSSGYGAPQDSQDTNMHGDISVVGDHDGMMGLMKKFAGIEGGQSQDYEDEEGHDEHDDHVHGEEEVCETCHQSQCQCDESEHIEEVESEDQMEFEVSEDQSDVEEKETTADEDAEAEEDKALAIQNSEDDEEDDEEKVEESLANGADDTFEADIHFMTKAIASGLDKEKSTGQTTIPVIAGQSDRMGYNTNESVQDWKKLAGIK